MANSESVVYEKCKMLIQKCKQEAAKRIVGQTDLIDGILMALVAGGHVLLEGVPGLAKTLAVKTFSDMSGFDFKRIQFTPDLLPADVTGTLVYEQNTSSFSVRKGPVFTNLLLADEINRAPAKVQSALLEAMAEKQVTIGDKTYALPEPFFVLATQNPIEQEGTYTLPEAELDRFLLKILVQYPSTEEEFSIIKRSASAGAKTDASSIPVEKIFSSEIIKQLQTVADAVSVDDKIIHYIVSIVTATRQVRLAKEQQATNASPFFRANRDAKDARANREDFLRYISFGASPRAGIALQKCAKVAALFAGRSYVLPDDVKSVAYPVLRHRLVLSYEAAADGLSADDLITKILAAVPLP